MPTNGLVKPEESGVSKKPFVMVGRQLDMDKILISRNWYAECASMSTCNFSLGLFIPAEIQLCLYYYWSTLGHDTANK